MANNEQEQPKLVMLTIPLVDEILKYLGTRPYAEVAGFIAAAHEQYRNQAELVAASDESEPDEPAKKAAGK